MSADNEIVDGDGFGLDKAARLEAGRETEAEVEPLEPPFPWNAEPFDPGFFNLAGLDARKKSKNALVSQRK